MLLSRDTSKNNIIHISLYKGLGSCMGHDDVFIFWPNNGTETDLRSGSDLNAPLFRLLFYIPETSNGSLDETFIVSCDSSLIVSIYTHRDPARHIRLAGSGGVILWIAAAVAAAGAPLNGGQKQELGGCR